MFIPLGVGSLGVPSLGVGSLGVHSQHLPETLKNRNGGKVVD